MDSPYDAFAWFYDRYWAAPFLEWQRPALVALFFRGLSAGATVVDVCCGTGGLARELVARGFAVIGIDASRKMLRLASENVRQGTFVQADASNFALQRRVNAAVCVFDSLNHITELQRLGAALLSIRGALLPDGWFVCDVNTPSAYGDQWTRAACEVHEDDASFLRGRFDEETQIGHTSVTMFRRNGHWRRADIEVQQRPWSVAEVESLLRSAGFAAVRSYDAARDLGMTGHYAIGRAYFRASCSPWGAPETFRLQRQNNDQGRSRP